jgi:catechol 2,3-dioxygenase-like lactoylglutathione lyase family enzyme
MSVGALDHFNVRTRDLKGAVAFYKDILGLENGARPNFAFPGAWLYDESRAVVHLVDISPTDEAQNPHSGVVHHVAFISRDFARMKKRLEATGVEFEARQVQAANSGRFSFATPMA